MELEIIIPKLYEDLEKLILVEWHKEENDYIRKGEVLFSVETEKTIFEVTSESDRTLKKIIIGNGATVKPMDIAGILIVGRE